MGTVWKATDSTLGWDVAIKVLPADFAADAERLARFEREATVLDFGLAKAVVMDEASLLNPEAALDRRRLARRHDTR